MDSNRREHRLDMNFSSSIKPVGESRRHFCIIRNIAKTGVFLTTRVNLEIGQEVECIMSFDEESITFNGVLKRKDFEKYGTEGYGIEIIKISEGDMKILGEVVEQNLFPGL